MVVSWGVGRLGGWREGEVLGRSGSGGEGVVVGGRVEEGGREGVMERKGGRDRGWWREGRWL